MILNSFRYQYPWSGVNISYFYFSLRFSNLKLFIKIILFQTLAKATFLIYIKFNLTY